MRQGGQGEGGQTGRKAWGQYGRTGPSHVQGTGGTISMRRGLHLCVDPSGPKL